VRAGYWSRRSRRRWTFLASMKDLKLPDGRDRVVRHGHGPERTIQTGIGPVKVRRAKSA